MNFLTEVILHLIGGFALVLFGITAKRLKHAMNSLQLHCGTIYLKSEEAISEEDNILPHSDDGIRA